MRTLASEWVEFSKGIPSDASKDQLEDMQTAFYGGATSLLDLILTQLTPGSEPEQEDLDMMTRLHEELENYVDIVKVRAVQKERT